jgi:hypothetical protein
MRIRKRQIVGDRKITADGSWDGIRPAPAAESYRPLYSKSEHTASEYRLSATAEGCELRVTNLALTVICHDRWIVV